MASALDTKSVPERISPASPPPLKTTIPSEASIPVKGSKSPKGAAVARNPNPIRSMLDIEPVKRKDSIPEETHSNDGSEEPHEALTPTSYDVHHQFHHVGSDHVEVTTTHTSNPGKPLTQLSAPTPVRPAVAASHPFGILHSSTPSPGHTPEPRRSSVRRPSTYSRTPTNAGAGTPSGTSPPSPTKNERPTFMKKARSFLKRSNLKVDQVVDQYAPTANMQQLDGPAAPSRASATASKSEFHTFTLGSRSERNSHNNSPPSPRSPNGTVNEAGVASDDNADSLTKSKTSNSTTRLNRFSGPRQGITWGTGTTDGGLQVPIRPRRRSASTEQTSKIRKPNERIEEDEEEGEYNAPLQATYSTHATEGVGLKARRLSLTLPDDFVVLTKELEKEYKSTRVFHSKGTLVGKGATAKVTAMMKKDGSKTDLYAVKEFRGKEKDESEYEYSQKIKSEYTLANSVNHPNIIRTFDLCMDKRKHYNHVMEFCPIEMYSVAEKGLFKTFYTLEAKICFLKQILRAVDYLHEHGIAHRDIKLENILMDQEGHLKLTDFGVSEVFCGEHPGARSSGGRCGQNMGEKRLCPPGICGSYPYMAPEVVERKDHYDPTKMDSWSCGILWLALALGGNIWFKPIEAEYPNFKEFMDGWRAWLTEHPASIPNDEIGYPKCGSAFKAMGSAPMKKLALKLLHPDPKLRMSVHAALQTAVIKNAECCTPESWEELGCVVDASKKANGKMKAVKQFKHNHLPPKDHKMPKMLQHRFDMGDGYQ